MQRRSFNPNTTSEVKVHALIYRTQRWPVGQVWSLAAEKALTQSKLNSNTHWNIFGVASGVVSVTILHGRMAISELRNWSEEMVLSLLVASFVLRRPAKLGIGN
jgi:hypothetical protein